ncbi:uncharacterized protein LOC34619477 [Cyclospora cayetanensis]|uniref:Uncharacterized protein LOC34619477 n=1 Tax=Cyclospora cayetanensis TaxID=88456 RepID=A0A6P6RRS8_9EIME|nr:uncharacterized protein LOC34619477 [Cyclospora cayetanensis]
MKDNTCTAKEQYWTRDARAAVAGQASHYMGGPHWPRGEACVQCKHSKSFTKASALGNLGVCLRSFRPSEAATASRARLDAKWIKPSHSFAVLIFLQAIEAVLLGPEGNPTASRDPIMEVVTQSPQEALTFIKWVAVFTALQVPQLPVRYLFFCHLSSCPRDRRSILNTVQRMTSGLGWRCSKALSILSYGWFILGVVWIFNSQSCSEAPGLWRITVTAIVVSMVRLAATFVCFWISLPPAATAAAAEAAGGAAAAGSLWRRGASLEEIQALPLVTYADKLQQHQEQQNEEQPEERCLRERQPRHPEHDWSSTE